MKSLNNIKFVATMGSRIEGFIKEIETAESWDQAKKIGNMVLGETDCMITYLNTMICEENNDFTEELSETIDSWMVNLYQRMATKAEATEQDSETIMKFLEKRDSYR